MRTVSFAMVFVATALHIAGRDFSTAAWLYCVVLLLVYPHLQYLRSRSSANPIRTEMHNLLADAVLLGGLIAVVEFSQWLAFSVAMGALSNSTANRGWQGMRQALLAMLMGVALGVWIVGLRFSPETGWPTTLVCVCGLGGYLLAMSDIGYFRNRQLRDTRIQLEARERELLSANQTLSTNLREIDALQNQLREQAHRDPLTGLYNRRFLDVGLEREMVRCSREGQALSVIMIDVDNFKNYNDGYGHQAGDECLKVVAQALKASAKRASDLAARYGGEEFSIVLPDTDAATALKLAQDLRQSIEALALPHRGNPAGVVTASLGVATMAADAPIVGTGSATAALVSPSGVDTLLRAADGALYQAKHLGRNRVVAA